jgi:transcriptional regulator with XRE-family HTH domain
VATKAGPDEEDIRRKLGRTIVLLRERRGITQAELARRSGVDRAFLHGIEHGKRSPTIPALVKIARGLNSTVSLLTTGIVEPEPGQVWDEAAWDEAVLAEIEWAESQWDEVEP